MSPRAEGTSEGASARAARLLDGLVERLARGGLTVRRTDAGGVEVLSGQRLAARLRPVRGQLEAEVDARAGIGEAWLLRRLGVKHPDRARAIAGWRLVEIHHGADANRFLEALRPKEGREREARLPLPALLVGEVRVRRLEDPPDAEDGVRVLVESEWPARLARDAVRLDHWWPEAAPGPTLRKAYGRAPLLERGFRRAYLAELKGGPKAEVVSRLRHLSHLGTLTLLVTVKDLESSHAVVLADAVGRPKTPRI